MTGWGAGSRAADGMSEARGGFGRGRGRGLGRRGGGRRRLDEASAERNAGTPVPRREPDVDLLREQAEQLRRALAEIQRQIEGLESHPEE